MRSILLRLWLVLLLLAFWNAIFIQSAGAQIATHVVINEFDQNPLGDDRGSEFVELFNPTSQPVNIGGWIIYTTHGDIESYEVPAGTLVAAGGFWQVTFPDQFIDNEDDSLVLLNALGQPVDETPRLSDGFNDDRSWQRFPDGKDTDSPADWVLASPSTKLAVNVPEFPMGTLVLVVSMIAVFLLLGFVKRARNLESSDHTTRDHTST